MHALLIFIGITQIGDIWVTLKMMHDLNLALNILDILRAGKLTFGNRLASECLPLLLMLGETGGAKLAAS